ncbi:MAG TPA: tRNA-uridine aminocarboxypropyltransferase, partial [Polyangiales bacterium]|nr:tRNA-uridine aminocarboxypropyltransferase [Polyangiales bacterium]
NNQTPITILQHKRESRHAIGTVRIAELGLARCHVEIVPASARSGTERPSWLPANAGLLYPGAGSRDLAELSAAERPGALVILDGTWHQARQLFRDHAFLHDLPRFSLSPAAPSRYRIRREPAEHCISTIEAIVQALSLLEPELVEVDALISAFDALIDDQIENARTRARVPRTTVRRPWAQRLLPRALLEHFERLVLVYAEAARPESEPGADTELVHWTALRVRDGARLDCVVRPGSGNLSAVRLSHLGLEAQDVENGLSLSELAAAWRAFSQSDDIVAAWNPRTFQNLSARLDLPVEGLGLKGVYRRIRGVDGDLDRVLSLEGAPAVPEHLRDSVRQVRGRAGQRLLNALAVTLFLRNLALAPALHDSDRP